MALCIPEKKNRTSNKPCTLSRDLMCKMWDEDRENVVECRYALGNLVQRGK